MGILSTSRKRWLVLAASLAAVAAATGAWWLHQPHHPTLAVHAAQAFVHEMGQYHYDAAFARTLGHPATGTSPLELARTARRQLCPPATVAYTLPFQSHGNRLRRWLADREVDEPQVRVEFEGTCLFGVTLRRVGPGQWRVTRFDSHAG